MYKRVTLEKFERLDLCKIPDYQFKGIEEEFEYVIGVLNKGIADGRNYLDWYMSSYKSQLSGMRTLCCMIGIDFEINFEMVDETETKGDELGTNVID